MQTISIIGLGNVGFHLVQKLLATDSNDFKLKQIYTSQDKTFLNFDNEVIITNNLNSLIDTDFVIITVPDYLIHEIVDKIPFKDALFIHTSGSTPIEVLNTKNKGVFYPLQTFSKQKNIDWSQVPLCLESNSDNNLNVLQKFALLFNDQIHLVNSEQRKICHLAAVFCCNFTNHMYHIGQEILQDNNLPFDLMMPLIKETTNKLDSLSPALSQTGPAVRGDYSTMNKHQALLNKSLSNLYLQISESIIAYKTNNEN